MLGFLLIFVITSLVFRAIRDNLSHDLAAQERLTGTLLFSLGVADVSNAFAYTQSMLTKGKLSGNSVFIYRPIK